MEIFILFFMMQWWKKSARVCTQYRHTQLEATNTVYINFGFGYLLFFLGTNLKSSYTPADRQNINNCHVKCYEYCIRYGIGDWPARPGRPARFFVAWQGNDTTPPEKARNLEGRAGCPGHCHTSNLPNHPNQPIRPKQPNSPSQPD